MQPKFVDKPAFAVVGMLIHTTAKNAEIPQLWDLFVPRMSEIAHDAEPHVSYGLMDHFDPVSGKVDYMAGKPVMHVDELPSGMRQWDVPANIYAVFETTIPMIGETFNAIFSQWLPSSGYQQQPAPYFEQYGADYHPENPVVSIYIPVVKKD